jgi:lactate dehydrogenase-like 2-hydroxyacid dehydrogenase
MLLLSGKTCVVVGLGEVGSRVAVAMQALGMKVHATRASAARPGAVQLPGALRPVDVHPAAHLRALLPSAALLFVCVPGNAQTEGLLGERELRLLPRGAVLVNVGRGAVVDEAALFAALSPGPGGAPPHLLGAGVDVWYNYPATVPPAPAPARLPRAWSDRPASGPGEGARAHEAVFDARLRGAWQPRAVAAPRRRSRAPRDGGSAARRAVPRARRRGRAGRGGAPRAHPFAHTEGRVGLRAARCVWRHALRVLSLFVGVCR